MTPELFGTLSTFLAIVAYVPYFLSMVRGSTRPHVFSWVLWTLLTWIIFAAQAAAGAGPAAWSTGVTALFCIAITAAALRYGEKNITRTDWAALTAGLFTIPLWVWTKDPTASAVLATAVDLVAFYPTFRKSWHKPREEMVFAHSVSLIKHALCLPALVTVSLATTVYPAALLVANIALVSMIIMRRRYR